jgi:hypothetical protein
MLLIKLVSGGAEAGETRSGRMRGDHDWRPCEGASSSYHYTDRTTLIHTCHAGRLRGDVEFMLSISQR